MPVVLHHPLVRFFGRDFTTRSCSEWSGGRCGARRSVDV